jgi:SAM-dependent methyltransferase
MKYFMSYHDSNGFTACSICGGSFDKIVYDGPIRLGHPEGDYKTGEVRECDGCGVHRLSELICFKTENYRDASYRDLVGHEISMNDYREKKGWVDKLHYEACNLSGIENVRSVADVGCAAGLFLGTYFQNVPLRIGIEPTVGFRSIVEGQGIKYFQYTADALKEHSNGVGLLFSFHVIEVVEDPLYFLDEIYNLLEPGGAAYIATPNRNDILMSLVPEFSRFWYRSTHRFYFNQSSLLSLVEKSNFKKYDVSFFHTQDFNNLCYWLHHRRPNLGNDTSQNRVDTEMLWPNVLNKLGLSDSLYLKLEK